MIADFLVVSAMAWGLVCLLAAADWAVGRWMSDD